MKNPKSTNWNKFLCWLWGHNFTKEFRTGNVAHLTLQCDRCGHYKPIY